MTTPLKERWKTCQYHSLGKPDQKCLMTEYDLWELMTTTLKERRKKEWNEKLKKPGERRIVKYKSQIERGVIFDIDKMMDHKGKKLST